MCPEVFVRDLLIGTNFLVSADTNGLPAVVPSGEPSISGDGRFVVFSSYASNLVAGVLVNNENVFLRDLQAGTTALVSTNITGVRWVREMARFFYTRPSAVTADMFSFTAGRSNLNGTVQSPGIQNLFLRDQLLATNYALSGINFSNSVLACMTSDGHYVAYVGFTNSLTGLTNLYVWNSQTASIIDTNTAGAAVSISPDGSWVAYTTASGLWAVNLAGNTSNLVAAGTLSNPAGLQFSADDSLLVFVQSNHVYLHNFLTGTNLLVDRSFASSNPAHGRSGLPAISPDGRLVAYGSTATDIVPNDATANGNIYLYDWTNNATTLISLNLAGNSTANFWSLTPEFSGDGSTLVFQSYASDLSALAFNEFGAIFALDFSSFGGTNSSGTNLIFSAQINGSTAAGQKRCQWEPGHQLDGGTEEFLPGAIYG